MLGYDIFDSPEKLGRQLYDFANENREYLLARGLNGFVERYGGSPDVSVEEGTEKAIQNADKGRFNHAKRISGHYLGFDDDDIIDSVGSIQVGLPLARPVVPILPTVVSRNVSFLTRDVAVDVNVSAVTRYDDDRLNGTQLAECYKFLLDKTVSWVDHSKKEEFTAWTLLPRANFSYNGKIYRAITFAGMDQTEIARFDERETRGVPALSFLLTRTITI